jgi:hypothetical protein
VFSAETVVQSLGVGIGKVAVEPQAAVGEGVGSGGEGEGRGGVYRGRRWSLSVNRTYYVHMLSI